jgi:1,4-dihydroxy-2-naphthoate octaprenyltransferase
MRAGRASVIEPDVGLRRQPLLLLFLATRPAFLTLTAVGVLLGWACAWQAGNPFNLTAGLATLLLALLAHAGANVINDYHDQASDAVNGDRLYPFTGGSRFIQNHLMTPQATALWGYLLLLSVVSGGLWLLHHAGDGLLLIGLLGLLLAWAYSSPPLRLSARSLGEVAVAGGWALVVMGSDYVQRHQFAEAPLFAGMAFGLLVAAVLFINEFPDLRADAATGKHTLVARLGARRASFAYLVVVTAAVSTLLSGIFLGVLASAAGIALLACTPAFDAYQQLRAHVAEATDLRPAILRTLLMAHGFGLLLALGLLVSQ